MKMEVCRTEVSAQACRYLHKIDFVILSGFRYDTSLALFQRRDLVLDQKWIEFDKALSKLKVHIHPFGDFKSPIATPS